MKLFKHQNCFTTTNTAGKFLLVVVEYQETLIKTFRYHFVICMFVEIWFINLLPTSITNSQLAMFRDRLFCFRRCYSSDRSSDSLDSRITSIVTNKISHIKLSSFKQKFVNTEVYLNFKARKGIAFNRVIKP